MEEEKIDISGKPYFLEMSDGGLYFVVSNLVFDEEYELLIPEIDEELGELKLGLDMVEIPNRGLSLLLRCREENLLIGSIRELKKYGEMTLSDYVALEPFGDEFGNPLRDEGCTVLYELRPRIFRKFVNN